MKVYIETYGCALNHGDSALMKMVLREAGFEIVDRIEDSDVVIINTCIVRSETEVRMIKRLKELRKLGKKIVVAGCMASALPVTVRKIVPEAVLLTPQAVDRVVEAIRAPPGTIVRAERKSFERLPMVVEGVRVTIPVAEGCLDECSFCIVRIARPRLASAPIEKVVDAVRKAVAAGARELEITAQDLGVYGVDLYGKPSFVELLRAILSIDADFVLRIGQINPKYLADYLDEMIDILRDPRVYKHLHIPVQSGDDNVLKVMNRGHDVELFENLVKEFRSKIVGIQIATDIIVGHPGEDDVAFLNTLKLLVDLELDRVHIARFSPRPMTKAASMPQVSDDVKKLRSRCCTYVYELVGLYTHLWYVGSTAQAIITEIDPERGTYVARLFNYKPVVLEKCEESDLLGKKVIIKIDDATFYDLRGKVLRVVD